LLLAIPIKKLKYWQIKNMISRKKLPKLIKSVTGARMNTKTFAKLLMEPQTKTKTFQEN